MNLPASIILVFLQAGGAWTVSPMSPTVGDTVVLARTFLLDDAGARARVSPMESGPAIEPLADPIVEYRPNGIRVRHVVAIFEAIDAMVMPDIELLLDDGGVEVIRGGTASIALRSLLPQTDSAPEPKGSLTPVARSTRDPRAVVIPVIAVSILVVTWGVVRRRSRQRPHWGEELTEAGEPPTEAWISAGEPRAVAALVMSDMRRRLASLVPEAKETLSVEECLTVVREARPDWPLDELTDVLHAFERASFAPAVPHDVLSIAEEVDALIRRLSQPLGEVV